MTADIERRSSHTGLSIAWMYPPELQPLLRELLATLLDFEHDCDNETIRSGSVDEWLKQSVIRKLQERNRERRAPHVAQLECLQGKTGVVAA